MRNMFANSKTFNQPIKDWDVRKVTNMNEMFYCATDFNQNLLSWDVSNVTNIWDMFSGAISMNLKYRPFNFTEYNSESETEDFEIYLLTEGTEFFYENENGEQFSFIANRLTVECPDFEDLEGEIMSMFEDLILTSKGDNYEPYLISDLPEIMDSEFINGVGNLNDEPFTSIEQCVEFINNLNNISFKSLNPKDGQSIKYIE